VEAVQLPLLVANPLAAEEKPAVEIQLDLICLICKIIAPKPLHSISCKPVAILICLVR